MPGLAKARVDEHLKYSDTRRDGNCDIKWKLNCCVCRIIFHLRKKMPAICIFKVVIVKMVSDSSLENQFPALLLGMSEDFGDVTLKRPS